MDEVKFRLFPYLLLPDLWPSSVVPLQSNLFRLRVCYSTILRRMIGVPPWNSAKGLFASAYVRSLLTCLEDNTKLILANFAYIETSAVSNMKNHWKKILFPS